MAVPDVDLGPLGHDFGETMQEQLMGEEDGG
jgi:hypothetical protein